MDINEIMKGYYDVAGLVRTLVADLDKALVQVEDFKAVLPTWEEAKKPEVLYTRMYEVNNTLDEVNRRLASIHLIRSSVKKLDYNSLRFDFLKKKEIKLSITKMFEIIADQEKALLSYKDTLDRKSRQLNAAQFMLSQHRFENEEND
jgi:hypothetical protein